MGSIYEFVRQQRDDYRSQSITIAEGYDFSQYETLRTIELYHNSRFLSGNKDSLKREKPFFNITKFRVNVATRATDLDTKDVKVKSDDSGAYVQSFLLTLKNRNWMKQNSFAVFLNEMGQTRAKYGGVLVKKTEQNSELKLTVMPWRDMITDQVDIRSGVKIYRDYYTPADLKKMEGTWNNIDEAIETAKKTKEAEAAVSGVKNRTPGAYIEVYFVDGVLPTCFLAGTSDKYPDDYGAENEYERQTHIVVLDESAKDKTNGATLFAGVSDEDPYKYLEYEKIPGRGLGIGVVEDLFEAQVWTNYTVQQKKDILDLAGKIIFQTSDQNIAAKNVLTDLENGSIITTGPNMPVTQVSNTPIALNGIAQLMSDWNEQAQNATSTYPAILGQTPPHGTAFRLQAGLVNEASALFEYRRQEAGIFISEIYRDWVLPFLVKQIKNDKLLVADLNPDELSMVSDSVSTYEATKVAKKEMLSGKLVFPHDFEALKQQVQAEFAKHGNRKGFNNFSHLFDEWKGTVDVDTTGEAYDRQAMLSTLFQLFSSVAQNPMLLQNPTLAHIFNEIVETAGASPMLQTSAQDRGSVPSPAAPGQPAAMPQIPTPPTGIAPASALPPAPALTPRG